MTGFILMRRICIERDALAIDGPAVYFMNPTTGVGGPPSSR
jgi:hypothetical protein